MIIIAGTLDFAPDERDAAVEAARELSAQTRELPGCLDYVWTPDPAVPGRMYVFERWEDEAALSAHFEGPLYVEMRKTLGAFRRLSTDISKYRIDVHEPVYDRDGKPRADFFTTEDDR